MNVKNDPVMDFPLSSLYINPTKYCNLCCRHCWLSPPVKDSLVDVEKELSAKEIIGAIEASRPLGMDSIKLTGGEPLLRSEAAEIIEYCASAGVSVIIETNGTLVTEDLADLIAKCEVDQVSISLDSFDEKVHDALRGSKGAYQRAMDGVKRLIDRGVIPQIVYSLYKDNIAHFTSFVEHMKKIGVRSIKINTISPVGRGKDLVEKGLAPTMQEVLAFRDTVRELSEDFSGRIELDVPMAFKDIEEIDTKGCGTCSINNILGILSDGSVSICGIGYVNQELVFGNIRSDGPEVIKDIWENNSFINDLRTGVPMKLKGVCGRCVFRNTCNGSCRAEVYHNTGDIYAPHWFCQDAYDNGMFPATRLVPEDIKKA